MPVGFQIKKDVREQIASAILGNPEKSYPVIGKEFGVCEWAVCMVAKQFNIKRPRGRAAKAYGKRWCNE